MMPLILIYKGTQKPDYVLDSLLLASKVKNIQVYFLTDLPELLDLKKKLFDVQIENIKDFYTSPVFLKNYMTDSIRFRNGFWKLTLERLFILESFINKKKMRSFFHGELDNVFFNLDKLSNQLDKYGNGMFLPRSGPNNMLASLMYVNDCRELTNFLNFVETVKNSPSEMELLSNYQSLKKSKIYTLPSFPSDITYNKNKLKRVSNLTGLVDAAALGQWLFGVDPRNHFGPTFNRFHNKNVKISELKKLKFIIDRDKESIHVLYEDENQSYSLHNLHIHSKKLSLFFDYKKLDKIICRINKGKRSLITFNFSSIFLFPRERLLIILKKMSVF
jgi:hypothetical protein